VVRGCTCHLSLHQGTHYSFCDKSYIVGKLHLRHTLKVFSTILRMTSQVAGLYGRWNFRFSFSQKVILLRSNIRLLGGEMVVETRDEFHLSWVHTSSAMLSSLQNWANHDRYRLRPSTRAQLCWSSSRLQPLSKWQPALWLWKCMKLSSVRANKINSNKRLWQNKVFLHPFIQAEHETVQAASTIPEFFFRVTHGRI